MHKFIINLLSKLGYKQAILAWAFENNYKSPRDNMSFGFTDAKGRNYYYFTDPKNMPLVMSEKMDELFNQLNSKMPSHDLDKWIESFELAINDEKKKFKLSDVGYWLGVLKERRAMTLEIGVLTEIAALMYIREDENPTAYNEAIHKEKYDMIVADTKEGARLYDFFQSSGLGQYIPTASVARENWMQFTMGYKEKVEAFNAALTRTLALQSQLSEAVKD